MILGTLMANFSCGTFWFIGYDTTCEYEDSGGATRLLRRRLVFRQFSCFRVPIPCADFCGAEALIPVSIYGTVILGITLERMKVRMCGLI